MRPSAVSGESGRRAVVIGGGIAGLFAARVLCDHFERVSLIERDSYPEEPTFRSGIPQGRHVHIILVRGQQIIEELFPGIKDKLLARGVAESDFLCDYRICLPSGLLLRAPSQLKGYTCTRLLLEWQIHQELSRYPQAEIVEEQEVVNLMANDDATAVTGVYLRPRTHAAPTERELTPLEADLVVDASGRDSKAPLWLKALGYTLPPDTTVNPFLGYASRIYAPAPDSERNWKGLIAQSAPPVSLRGGIIWPIEKGNWMVVLAGTGKDYPPTGEENFLEFARSLPDPLFYEALCSARPLSPIYGYRRTENRRRHFERMERQPAGFVALGDAVCAFNPVYGQGMTVAALDALILRECLSQSGRDGLSTLPRRFQQKVFAVNEFPWTLATSSDYRSPAVEGGQINRSMKLQFGYLNRLFAILPHSFVASRAFLSVIHMVKSPAAFFHPAILWKMLTYKSSR